MSDGLVFVLVDDVEYFFLEGFCEDIEHFIPVFVLGVVFDGEDDGIVVFIFLAVGVDFPDGLGEVDGLAERLVLDGVGDDRRVFVVVHIDLHALYPPHQVLHVPLYLRVARQLIPGQVRVVGTEAEVVRQRIGLIHRLGRGRIVGLLALQEGAEIVETYLLLGLFQN